MWLFFFFPSEVERGTKSNFVLIFKKRNFTPFLFSPSQMSHFLRKV